VQLETLKSEKRSDGQDGRVRLRKGVIYLLAMRQNGSTSILKTAMPLLRRVLTDLRALELFLSSYADGKGKSRRPVRQTLKRAI